MSANKNRIQTISRIVKFVWSKSGKLDDLVDCYSKTELYLHLEFLLEEFKKLKKYKNREVIKKLNEAKLEIQRI